MKIDYSKHLEKLFPKLSIEVQKGIFDFVQYVMENGLEGLPGRNKSSASVSRDDRTYLAKVKFATDYKLFHYHLGVPTYDKTKGLGSYTSEWVIHYVQVDEDTIKCVHVNPHSRQLSFRNPSPSMLEKLE